MHAACGCSCPVPGDPPLFVTSPANSSQDRRFPCLAAAAFAGYFELVASWDSTANALLSAARHYCLLCAPFAPWRPASRMVKAEGMWALTSHLASRPSIAVGGRRSFCRTWAVSRRPAEAHDASQRPRGDRVCPSCSSGPQARDFLHRRILNSACCGTTKILEGTPNRTRGIRLAM